MTIKSVYEKYVAYLNDLHADMDAARNTGTFEPYRPRLLSLEDFSAMWERWGRQEGLRERWLGRFSIGYDRDVAELKERLGEALGVSAAEGSATSAANRDKAAA